VGGFCFAVPSSPLESSRHAGSVDEALPESAGGQLRLRGSHGAKRLLPLGSASGIPLWVAAMDGLGRKLDQEHRMRMAGRFRRRVRACAQANQIPVKDGAPGERKHQIGEQPLRAVMSQRRSPARAVPDSGTRAPALGEPYIGSDDLPAALRPVDSEDLYPRRARAWCRGSHPPYARTPLGTLAGEVPRDRGRGQEYSGPIEGGPELDPCLVADGRLEPLPAPAQAGKTKAVESISTSAGCVG
jgi:hypothetical protein